MDEARLQEIEEWADDHVPRCYECDGIARVIVPGTSRPLCAACAPDVPGAVLPLVSVYATTLDLVAAVRRLTAALDAVTTERDNVRAEGDRLTLAGAVPGLITGIVRKILGAGDGEATPTAAQRVVRERDEARGVRWRARREGAEEMREACAERVRYLRGDLGAEAILRGESPVTPATEALSTAERLIGRIAVDDVIGDDDTIRALPLDAPGGGS